MTRPSSLIDQQLLARPHSAIRRAHARQVTMAVVAQEQDQAKEFGPARYFLMAWDGEHREPAIEDRALSLIDAAETFLLDRGLARVAPFPPWSANDRREDPYADPSSDSYALCILEMGARFLIGEANWGEGREVHAREILAGFTVDEISGMVAAFESLARI